MHAFTQSVPVPTAALAIANCPDLLLIRLRKHSALRLACAVDDAAQADGILVGHKVFLGRCRWQGNRPQVYRRGVWWTIHEPAQFIQFAPLAAAAHSLN